MTGGRAGQASEAAVEAAARVYDYGLPRDDPATGAMTEADAMVFGILHAAHDPALGLDRSVRLGDVVEAVRDMHGSTGAIDPASIAYAVERRFTGEADDGN